MKRRKNPRDLLVQSPIVRASDKTEDPASIWGIEVNSGGCGRIESVLKERVASVFSVLGLTPPQLMLEEFWEDYTRNPSLEGSRSTSIHTLFWLHLLMKSIRPDFVIESGVHIGRSLWTLLRAADPNANIFAFDVTFDNLKWRDDRICYWEDDIVTFEFPEEFQTGETFAFLDDHINNCERILLAKQLGIRHIVFDDSPGFAALSHFGYPGVPTAQMILEDIFENGDTISWNSPNGRERLTYTVDKNQIDQAREAVEVIKPLPSLGRYTGNGSATEAQTYVRIKL